MHFGVARFVGILRRAGRSDDGGVHNRAGAQLQPPGLQRLADRGKKLLAELVLLQQPPKPQQRRAVGHALSSQVDAHEAAQRGAVEQRFLTRLVGQVEPVLHEVHAQHALQPNGRPSVASLRIVRLDHLAHRLPRHDLIHRRQKHIAPGRPTVALESGTLIGRCGKSSVIGTRSGGP